MQIFVERIFEHADEANVLKEELKKYLGLLNLNSLRIVQKYTLKGINQEQMEEATFKIFAKEGVDTLLEESDILSFTGKILATKPLETQYNQKADICVLQLRALFPNTENISVLTETIYLFDDINDSELLKVKGYLINPLETSIISLDKNINTVSDIQDPIFDKSFFSLSLDQLEIFGKTHNISMISENLVFVQDYFKKEKRIPTITELKILDTYWSDHCRHSTFLTVLDDIQVEESLYQEGFLSAQEKYIKVFKTVYPQERPECLMDMATLEMKRMKLAGELSDLEKSDEVNACSVEISAKVDGKDEDFILMFKNETHNHPTEIEPFGGAATCIGGGIRDPLSGRSNVFGAMRITGSGDPRETFEDTMEGKLAQRKITKTAADGYSSYANQIGLASTYLAEYYDDGFKAKRMECGALVAFNFKKNIIRENASEGDVVILLGGKTGRDGLGGATGSSNIQAGGANLYSAEVQKGNPLLERSILRMFRKPEVSRIIKKCNDFGAGGVSVAIGELAEGLYINLDSVPYKLAGMTATELAISESQERMAVVIDLKNAEFFISEAKKENLEATVVANVNNSARMVMEHEGKIVCNLSSDFLNSGGIRQHTDVFVKAPKFSEKEEENSESLRKSLLNSFKDLNLCTKEPIARQFDKTVGGASAFYPFGGKNRKTPEQGLAMRIPLETGDTNLGTIMTVGYDPKSCYESPFHAAMFAVAESILKAVSMGGNLSTMRLSFQEYFERMTAASNFGKVYSALLGAFAVQNELSVPSIGGKDSMSGTYKDISVPPSLLSFAMAPCDVTKLISRSFKKAENKVYLLKTKLLADKTIDFDSLRENIKFFENSNTKILTSSVVGAGGIANAVFEMCLGNDLGFTFADNFEDNLFEKSYVNLLLESNESLALPLVGEIILTPELRYRTETIPLDELKNAWSEPLNEVFGKPLEEPAIFQTEQSADIYVQNKLINTRPNVTILVLPGTVGEYTIKRLYEKSGAEVNTHVFDIADFQKGYQSFADKIKKTDILVFPSGLMAGGEPNSVGSFLTIILSEDTIKREVNALIDRGGLILGLGESFSTLIELGLIEHGRIERKTDSMTVLKNPHAKFYSGLIPLDSLNTITPWIEKGDFAKRFVPLSLIEGKLIISNTDYLKYIKSGQITLRFSDENPLHSGFSIAGMTSENGQVFGSFADLSLLEEGLYQNVTDTKSAELFGRSVDFIKGKGGS